MPPERDPTLKEIHIKLSGLDRARLDRLAAELGRRTGTAGSRTAAIRWALRELERRLATGPRC